MKDILDKFLDWWDFWGELIKIGIGSVGIYIVICLFCILFNYFVVDDKKYSYCETINASYYIASRYATPVCMRNDGTLTPIKYETARD
jgi:hypothetical protein